MEGQRRPTGYGSPTPGLGKCKILSLGSKPAALGRLKNRRFNSAGPHDVHCKTAVCVADMIAYSNLGHTNRSTVFRTGGLNLLDSLLGRSVSHGNGASPKESE